MAPRPPSRIPRAHSTSTAPPAASAADENAPPARPVAPTTRGAAAAKGVRVSAIPLAPATTATRSAAQLKSALSSTRQSTTRPRPVAHVVIQGPSSDPPAADGPDSLDLATSTARPAFHDERDDDGDHEQHHSNRTLQMPTPPNSQETSSFGEAVWTDQGDQGLLAPARTTRRTRSPSSQPSTSRAATTASSRRASRSPAVEIVPDGPSHAPHILAARRRSSMSVSPHPPPTSTAAVAPIASTSAAPSSAAPAPTAKPKGKRTKLRPRASEILDAPLAAPDAIDADGEIDPLLLLGPEQTRGRGEGRRKRGMAAQVHGRVPYTSSASASAGSSGRAARALEAGRAAAAARLPSPPATQEDDDDDVVPVYQPLVFGVDEAAQGDGEDPADLGGFDAPVYHDDQGQVAAEPLVAQAAADVIEPAAQDVMDEEDEGGFAHLDEADSSARGYSSSDNGDANADAYLAAYSSASDDDDAGAAPSSLYALGQIPTVRRTRPSYPPLSPNRTGEWDSTVAVELGSSPPPPMREPTPGFGGARRRSVVGAAGASAGARGRPSYPPLSPNTTGEFDSQCPVRLGSSPPPSPGGSNDGELDGEAARGKPASSEWRDEVDADVKVEDDVVEDAFLAPRRSTPVPSTSTSAARTASTSISTPSNLLFLSAFRSPSPAISPIPRPSGSSRSPQQPQLNFVSPRKTLDHLTNLVVPSPASARAHSRTPSPLAAPSSSAAAPALAPARDPSPSQGPSASPHARSTWTRGPAFFRSSSFSPPAHAALPRTATLYARRPGQGQDERNEDEADEGSREYHRFADLTATSPMPVGEGEAVRDEHEQVQEEERDEEEVEVGIEPERLERAQREAASLSRSASAALAQSPSPSQDQDDVGPPTPAKDRHSSPADAAIVWPPRADDVDEAMASPASSTGSMRSCRSSLASPARSANGDVLMSSPSPRNSPVVAAFTAGPSQARSPGSPPPSVEHERERAESQQLASTPGRRLLGDDDDARMASPSPARQGSPLKARIGELVGGGRTKLQGLLFGPRASTPRAASVEVDEGARVEAQALDEPSHEARVEEQDDDNDEPFQLQPAPTKAQRSRAPASVADSTFTSLSHSRSHASFASSASTSTSYHRRRRPSHPTLPVIEITSTDPRAAARAAAILKVHHKYVEQGFTAVDAARAAASAFDAADAAGEQDGDSEDDEELRTLLLDAEEELRDQAPHATRSASISTAAPSTTTTVAGAGAHWTSHEWRKLEQALVELGRRQRRATSAASSSAARSMRSESIAMASVVGDECEPEQVVEAFLRSVGRTREDCVGEWARNKLVIRVEALKARRSKDARQRRATSFASTSRAGSGRPGASLSEHIEAQHEQAPRSSSEEGASDHEPTPEAHPVVKQEQLSDEDDLGAASPQVESDESDEDGELGDDTFFSSSKRERSSRQRRGSVEPVYVPTALANPALRHLYDDFQPEKPKLPLKDILREDSPSSSSSSAAEEDEDRGDLTSSAPRESTPGAAGDHNEPPRSPSSAQRLMSYLGSFVRRSPAPAPSPASSTRALPADSSASPSPSPEMQQVQLSASLVTPRFASTAKPYPPLPSSATHKPLPPVAGRVVKPLPHHRSDASTSHSTLDVVAVTSTANESTTSAADSSGSSANSSTSFSSSRRRRRSSGEGNSTSLGRVWAAVDAIEEAESSREEEESRIIELLRSGSAAKRRAAGGDLRERTEDVSSASTASGSGSAKGKGREASFRGFVELEEELGRGMIPSGARALDRRVSGERRVSKR
ncbi:hypothetical protein JCM9279_000790 [Rhodotorula babjevae]